MKLRKIVVQQQSFLWQREHIHLSDYEFSPCMEKIIIYLETYKKSPLRLFIKQDDNKIANTDNEKARWCLNGFGDGVVWFFQPGSESESEVISINFNRPAVIKDLITYFLNHGWNPTENKHPLEIMDGIKYLDRIDLTKGD